MNKNIKKISITIFVIAIVIIIVVLATKNLLDKNKSNNTSTQQNVAKNTSDSNQTMIEDITQDGKDLLKIQSDDIVLGDQNAPITIIEYASLSCPHCAAFYSDGFSKLKEEYIDTAKVKFIYRDFPLNHPALTAAVTALCQAENNNTDPIKYHNFVKALFKTQDSWAFGDDFVKKLENIAILDGMSNQRFNECIKNIKLQESILEKRLNAAKVLQISSTPTFFINDKIMHGFTGYGDIKNIIEAELSKITNQNNSDQPKANL